MKFKLSSYKVFFVGLVMGVGAAVIQAYFKVQPPEAYGISFIGHPNDLFIWLSNKLVGTDWPIRDVFLVFPALMVVGVVIGSMVAASRNKELRLQPGPVRKKFLAVIFGFLIANFGLLWGSCPIRTALLIGYGSGIAVIAMLSIVAGIMLAIVLIRIRARRGIPQ